jgi:hypothetical protein
MAAFNRRKNASVIQPRSPKHPLSLQERLRIDASTCTATLDGQTFNDVDQDALRALKALRDAQLAGETPISKRELRERYLPSCFHDTTFSRWIDSLPEKLRCLVIGKQGTGLRLILPSF